MEMRRKDRKLDEQIAVSLLEHCEYAVLSTVDGDGNPYGVPISPVLEGKNLYFHCALEGRKLRFALPAWEKPGWYRRNLPPNTSQPLPLAPPVWWRMKKKRSGSCICCVRNMRPRIWALLTGK